MDVTLLASANTLASTLLSGSGSTDGTNSRKSETTVRIPSMVAVKMSEPMIFTGGKCTSRIEVNRAECTSAVTASVSSSEKDFHVVKIKILPQQESILLASKVSASDALLCELGQSESETVKKPKVTVVSFNPSLAKELISPSDKDLSNSNRVLRRILHEQITQRGRNCFTSDKSVVSSTKSCEMVQKPSGDLDVNNPTYLYYMMTSGQCSPSDTLDSGTCSDLENGNNNTAISTTPPPLPKKVGPKLKLSAQNCKAIGQDPSGKETEQSSKHNRKASFTDSEESESSLSCDSLNSSDRNSGILLCPTPSLAAVSDFTGCRQNLSFFPDSLLRDIRDRKFMTNKDSVDQIVYKNSFTGNLNTSVISDGENVRDKNKTCVLITQEENKKESSPTIFENDKFYIFHINEKDTDHLVEDGPKIVNDETFAGYKDIHSSTSTIRSSKGTVRGVKNRVRNGIATFLQMQQSSIKNYKEKDCGKVVLYTTSMGIVRETYAKCANVKQILRTLLIKFEERDVFMSNEYQQEIKERMQRNEIHIPQLFVEGQHIGDADIVERLNETGELRKMLKPYKSMNASITCQVCGGYRLLPCPSCSGSKKSVHRNHFTAEFVALKCMNCDEVGLVKCHNC